MTKSLMRLKCFTSHSLYKNKSNMNNEYVLNIIFSFKTLVVLFILNEKNYNRWLNSLLVKKWLNYTYLYGIHWKDFQLRRLPNAWKLCIYIAYIIIIFHFILETFYELENANHFELFMLELQIKYCFSIQLPAIFKTWYLHTFYHNIMNKCWDWCRWYMLLVYYTLRL